MTETNSVQSMGIPSYEEYVESQKRQPKNELGKDDFLNLLAAQMKYQDPMEPQTDTAFVAQLAQFSSLEQISQLNQTMAMTQYYNMAGKYVYADVTMADGSTHSVSGLVDRVVNQDGTAYLQVGDYLFKATAVTQVYDKDLFTSGNPLLETANLIGKEVKAITTETYKDEDGEEKTREVEHSGTVTRVALDSNGSMVAYLRVDGQTEDTKVPIGSIVDIKEKSAGTSSTETP